MVSSLSLNNKTGFEFFSLFIFIVSFVAVLFLAISTVFELVCVLLYAFIFPKLPIVKYFRAKAAAEGSKTVSADLAAGGIQTTGVCFSFQM